MLAGVLSMRMRPWGRSKPSLLFTLLCRQYFCAGRKQPSKRLKFDGSEGTVFSSCVGFHRLTLLWRFGGERRRRERQARSDVLSFWVTYLPQRSSSEALRGLFSFARVGSQRHTLLSLVGEAHLRHERHVKAGTL